MGIVGLRRRRAVDRPGRPLRWVALAEAVLDGRGGRRRRRALAALRRRAGDRRRSTSGSSARRARPTCSPFRSTRSRPRRPLPGRGRDRPGLERRSRRAADPPRRRRHLPGGRGRNAADHAGTFDDEIALLLVHGILHLLGHGPRGGRRGRGDGAARAGAAGRYYRPSRVSLVRGLARCHRGRSRRAIWSCSSVVVLLLVAASAVLALAETSLVRTQPGQGARPGGRRPARRRSLLRLVEYPEGFLNPVLLLVLICQLVAATLVGILAADSSAPWGWWSPRCSRSWSSSCSARRSRRTGRCSTRSGPRCSAPRSSRPSWFLAGPDAVPWSHRARQPADRAGDQYLESAVTESELLAMADVAVEDDVIETEERALIHSIIEFGDTIVREVMVPRPDIVTVGARRIDRGRARARPRGRVQPHPGLPSNIDDVVGIAYTKDLIRAGARGAGRRRGRRPRPAGPLRPRDQAGGRSHARDAGRASSTWRSSSTSTAAPPGS